MVIKDCQPCQQKLKFFRWCRKPKLWVFVTLFVIALLVAIGPLKVLFDRAFLVKHLEAYQCCAVALYKEVIKLLSSWLWVYSHH